MIKVFIPKEDKNKTTDGELSLVVVTAVDEIVKRVRIYYVGYGEQFHERRAQRMEPLRIQSSSLHDRMEFNSS